MIRKTCQRAAIRAVFDTAQGPLSPLEILEFARAAVGGLGIATVYRTVNHLVDAGELTLVELPGEAPRYERAGAGHHHHFQCRDCRKVYCVYGCPGVQGLIPPGFAVETHEIAMQGVCRDCRQEGKTPAGTRRTGP